ncbi:MAG: hypothetical protein R3F34_12740 [Planctomycetota bacterium]
MRPRVTALLALALAVALALFLALDRGDGARDVATGAAINGSRDAHEVTLATEEGTRVELDRVAVAAGAGEASEQEPGTATVRGRVLCDPIGAPNRTPFGAPPTTPLVGARVLVFPWDMDWSRVPPSERRTPESCADVRTTTTDDEGRFELGGLDASTRWRSLVLAREGCTSGLVGLVHRGDDEVVHALEPLQVAACRVVDEDGFALGPEETAWLALDFVRAPQLGPDSRPFEVTERALCSAALAAGGVDPALLDANLLMCVDQGRQVLIGAQPHGEISGRELVDASGIFVPCTQLPAEVRVEVVRTATLGGARGRIELFVESPGPGPHRELPYTYVEFVRLDAGVRTDATPRVWAPLLRDVDRDGSDDRVVRIEGVAAGRYLAMPCVRRDGARCATVLGPTVLEVPDGGVASATLRVRPTTRVVLRLPESLACDPTSVGLRVRQGNTTSWVEGRGNGSVREYLDVPAGRVLLQPVLPPSAGAFGWARTAEGQDAAMATLRGRFPDERSCSDLFDRRLVGERIGSTEVDGLVPLHAEIAVGATIEVDLVLEPAEPVK